jgi:hypothetical protein
MTHVHAAAPHCHYSYLLPASGYRSFGWWPTPDDALSAARVHDDGQDAKLITEHAPGCACPKPEGSPE